MALCDRSVEAPLLDWATIDWFGEQCFFGEHSSRLDPADPRISPYRAADHSRLPPALVLTAGADLLCHDGETYAANGVYLHEWYFEILGGNGKFENARELTDALTTSYGSVEAFIKYFSECAMAARGWSVLAWDTRESRLWIYNADAHNQGGVWGALPIIVLDVYEHAYFMDYGADRKAYLKAFWKNFNWSAANDLYKRASSIRL